MNKLEVISLLKKIKNRYHSFQVPDDTDKARAMVDDLYDDFFDVPFETALENFRRYTSRVPVPEFAPAIPILVQPLDTEQDMYYSSMRRAGLDHLSKVDEMKKTAAPPPEEIRRIMRLPDTERWEALKAYAAARKQISAGS